MLATSSFDLQYRTYKILSNSTIGAHLRHWNCFTSKALEHWALPGITFVIYMKPLV